MRSVSMVDFSRDRVMTSVQEKISPDDGSLQPAEPCVIVIFGAAGDLTKRLLIPALYNLASGKLLPQEFAVVGFARHEMSSEDFRSKLSQDIQEFATVEVKSEVWDWFQQRVYYVQGNFDDTDAYQKLKELLAKLDEEHGTHGNYLYYLATSDSFFSKIVQQLGDVGLMQEEDKHWRRAIIEKPFGHDLNSAREISTKVSVVC